MNCKPSRLIAVLFLTAVSLASSAQATFESLAAEGDLAFTRGTFADAEKAYLEALERAKETREVTSRQAVVLNSLATIYNLEGRYLQAEALCQRALTLLETSSSKTDPALASIFGTLGSINLHLGKYTKAEHSIQQAIAIYQQDSRDHHVELLADYTLLGVALCSQERCKQADQVVQHALTLCEPNGAGCQNGIAAARATLAAIYARRGQYRQAEELYRSGLETLERAYGPSSSSLVPILSDLASLYASRNRFSEAEATGRRALEIAAKQLPDSDAAAKAALAVGQALAGQRHYDAAEPYFKQALAIHERTQGAESIQYAWFLRQYAQFLQRAKRSREASDIETRANAMLHRAGQKVDVSEFPKH
jgi:tetratricopeptide (TPR) repeat protein